MPRRRRKFRRPKNWPQNLKLNSLRTRIRYLEAELRAHPKLVAAVENAAECETKAKQDLQYEARREELLHRHMAIDTAVYGERKNYRFLRWLGRHSAVHKRQLLVPEAIEKLIMNQVARQDALQALEEEVKRRQLELMGPAFVSGDVPLPRPPRHINVILAELETFRKALKNKKEKRRVDVKEYERSRAARAAYEGRTREVGALVRRQLEATETCPYCGGMLGEDAHADHIYPVSRGGQSTTDNMVMVCRACNMAKGDKTLREYIELSGLNRAEIEKRLEELGKVF